VRKDCDVIGDRVEMGGSKYRTRSNQVRASSDTTPIRSEGSLYEDDYL
jgi:hypothetical protein